MKMSYRAGCLRAGVRILALGWAYGVVSAWGGQPSIAYLPTRNDGVKDMLYMAGVGKGDVVYDLGSGDGRIVIAAVRDFGARRAAGIEKDAGLVAESRANARKAGVEERVEFVEGDLFAAEVRQADVVTVFLGHEPNITLRAKLVGSLKPGSRIVSHQFGMGEWEPDKTLTARTVYFGMWGEAWNPFMDNPRVPDYSANESHFGTTDKMMMWIVPAAVAGVWRGKIDLGEGAQDCRLILHQRLSAVNGMLEIEGQAACSVSADLWGRHLRFGAGRMLSQILFDGHVEDDALRGTIAVCGDDGKKESTWEAVREKVDFCGTWEWPCASGPRAVRLRVERRDGRLCATYVDRGKEAPVSDFYDWGGGFYFTRMIGRDEDGIVITEDTGWLVAEGVIDDGALVGKIEFHPYASGPAYGMEPRTASIQEWSPTLIMP